MHATRYLDDTFTILDRNIVDSFLQHLNNQQPTIRFTRRLGHTWCDLKASLIQANKMVSFIRFLANATKSISGKQGERCMKGLLVPKPPRFRTRIRDQALSNLERG